jgi:hypothetical protein
MIQTVRAKMCLDDKKKWVYEVVHCQYAPGIYIYAIHAIYIYIYIYTLYMLYIYIYIWHV